MFAPLVHRLQGICLRGGVASVSRCCSRMAPVALLDALPSLGHVLYVPMRLADPAVLRVPCGVLVETIQLAPLLQVRWLVAASTITLDGPREWIECVDEDARCCARLHLLPDTDYLAWDALLGCGEPVPPVTRPARWPWYARPASAQLLRFHTRRLAGLTILGGEITAQVSPLSRHLAGVIARAEAVPLR